MASVKCPKCGGAVEPCGEVEEMGGTTVAVYQCCTCTIDWQFDGDSIPCAYTFVIGPDGIARDPVEPIDPSLN